MYMANILLLLYIYLLVIRLLMHLLDRYLPGAPERILSVPGLNKLRTSRVLEAGMVLTNEPG